MSAHLKQLKEKFIHDAFVADGLGAVIDGASYGFARVSMEIQPRHCNALGIPMGGAIFTLADFAFAVAANQGRDVVTQASQITFLKAAQGKRLIAEARQVKDGKRVCFYEVKVNDDLGTEVAFVTINGYVVSP
ncbi:MAG: PaaI family thioesterase [Ruminiclostridium sp.]|nr:PaaI family thioesterase [Ruminiclostridium sp.]